MKIQLQERLAGNLLKILNGDLKREIDHIFLNNSKSVLDHFV